MVLYLIRYSEIGLKSDRVRNRFIRSLISDIEERMIECGIQHLISRERGRIFLETSSQAAAEEVLKRVGGIYSFSPVRSCPSDMDSLMKCLEAYGRGHLGEGMTYGLKVKRFGKHDYTSQEIAIEGGKAVVAHLPEGSTAVDLKRPDLWIEIDIRGKYAYIFKERIMGIGGMPRSSQGRVILYLPPMDKVTRAIPNEIVERASLSYLIMQRRGCKVLAVTDADSFEFWMESLGRHGITPLRDPIPTDEEDRYEALSRLAAGKRAHGVAFIDGGEDVDSRPLHASGLPIGTFYPTWTMKPDEVREWIVRLAGSSSAPDGD